MNICVKKIFRGRNFVRLAGDTWKIFNCVPKKSHPSPKKETVSDDDDERTEGTEACSEHWEAANAALAQHGLMKTMSMVTFHQHSKP